MSQANRASPGLNGTLVYVRRSGIAIMSGDAGVCPIGPAAKPANPAPSLTRPSKFDIGTSLADGFACMSTNCAKKNSIPSSSALLLIASAAGRAMIVAISSLSFAGCGPRQLFHAAT